MLRRRGLPKGRIAVLYDKNERLIDLIRGDGQLGTVCCVIGVCMHCHCFGHVCDLHLRHPYDR